MKKFLLSLVSLLMLTLFAQAGAPYKLLTFPDYNDKSIGSYTAEWTATVDGDVWTLNGFNNNSNKWESVKCGRKDYEQTATITSPAVDKAITHVLVSVLATKNVTSATLTVLNGAEVVGEPKDITGSFITGEVVTEVAGAAGYSYKLTVNSKAGANGSTEIGKVALYEEGQYVDEATHIANDAESAYTVARAIELIEAGESLSETVYVKGIVSQVDNYSDKYKSITYWISDDGTTTNQFECYSGKGIGGADFASIDDVKVGASVIVKGTMKKYTPKEGDPIYEFNQNNELVSYEAPAEPVYIQNADFASLEGWTAVTSESYKDLGNGLIGTYQVRGEFDAATVDETHLATEYCIGLEARWNTNFASYTQTVTTLPAGSYSLVYDVENVNAATTAADYENRFTVTVGETVYSDSFTEWMKGKSAWTTHAIVFTVEEGQQVTISLGYGTGSNNLGVSNTPALFVSHLKLADAATGEALILAKAKEEKLAVLDAFVAGEGLFQYSQRAIEVAKRAVNAANTVEEVEAVDMPTPTLPDAEKQYTLQQKASGLYMSLSDGVKLAAKAYPLSWVATEGGWYIKNEDLYVGLAGSDNWTMSTDADKKLVITPAAIDIEGVVYYTLSEVKGMIASDGTEAGSACYTDKSVAKSGDKAYWAIAEYVAPVAYTVTISDEIANGTVVAAPTEAEAGETITLTITPAEGYELDQLEVLGANGAVVVVTDNTFTMPAANVRVFATFKEAASNDYTSYIKNADLSDASSTAWDTEGTKGYHKDVSGVVTAANNAVYDFKQTIEGLPAGKYKVSVQAAYRYGADEQAEADAYFNDAIETKFAKLYATVGKKTVDVLVKNRYDGATDTDWADGNGSVVVEGKPVPNSTAAVKAWFDAKQYTNELEFNLAEAGDVTIGIVKTAQPEAGDYTVIGPWTLTRLGDAEEEPEPTPDPTDYTSSIVNPSFETGDLTGWTVGSSSDTGVKPNSNATYTTEGCDGDYLFNTWWQGIPITQTVTGLPNGLYELKALMANDAGEGNADKPCLYLLANGTHSEAFGSGTKSKFTECSMQFYVTDGTATIGAIGGNTDGSFNEAGYYWYKVDNFRLTFIEALPNIDDIVIPEGKMSNAAATAITTAKEAGDVIALLDAVKVAQVSIVAYASAANAIADAKAIAANTNVYTAEAYQTFAAAIEGVENAYNDGTLSDKAAAAAGATLGTVVTGWRAGAEGAAVKFMESAYNLNGFDGALYVNTWSTEGYSDGSDFAVPFYEYFTGGDQALAPQTFTTTVTGLEAGSYEVSALIRVQLKDGETVPAGITLDGNGGAAVDALGEEATSANLFLKETTTLATVGADGVLSININVLEGNNVHWLSFKNVKYAAKDETEYAYEQALASIVDGETYMVSTEVNEKKFYLNNTGYLVADAQDASIFELKKVTASGTVYETGINLGCKFTNPNTGGKTTFTNEGHILTGNNDRNDWERQVFFLKDGKYAIRATNANDAAWGSNTYWDVFDLEAELPNAGYALEASYVWNIEKTVDRSALDADIAALEAIIAATDSYVEIVENAAQTATAALTPLKEAVYTTTQQAKEAQAEVKAIGKTFFASIKAVTPIDVTDFYIANPGAQAKKAVPEGWEGTKTNDASSGVSEFWNQSAADLHQTIYLPAGDYCLTVVALQRSLMTGVIYAGEEKTQIVGVGKDVVNDRSQAANWFAAGNGLNEVYFTLPETTDIHIGLTADKDNGDHWTVWQSFKLEKIADAARPGALSALNKTLAANVPNPATAGDGLFMKSLDAYDTYVNSYNDQKAVAENTEATTQQLKDALVALENAIQAYAAAPKTMPEAGSLYSLQQKSSGKYLSVYANDGSNGVRIADQAQGFSWTTTDGGYYLSNEIGYVGLAGSNDWTMSALETNKLVINATPYVIADGVVYYTLSEVKGLIATDGTDAGAACYANKSINDNALWAIAEYVVPISTYAISITPAENGTVEADKTTAAEGEEVTVTVAPAEGYMVDEAYWTFVDGAGTPQKYEFREPEAGNSASFTMPAADVTITVTFKEIPAPGKEYQGLIEQTLTTPDGAVMGSDTGDQTVTITAAGEGKVNITFSGFKFPVMPTTLPKFTIEGVTAVEANGVITYAINDYTLVVEGSGNGQMGGATAMYTVNLLGTQEGAEATPVMMMTLETRVLNTVYFGADADAIAAYKQAVGIKNVKSVQNAGTIYDLSGRKVEKVQRGGIYIINGKKVSVK